MKLKKVPSFVLLSASTSKKQPPEKTKECSDDSEHESSTTDSVYDDIDVDILDDDVVYLHEDRTFASQSTGFFDAFKKVNNLRSVITNIFFN